MCRSGGASETTPPPLPDGILRGPRQRCGRGHWGEVDGDRTDLVNQASLDFEVEVPL